MTSINILWKTIYIRFACYFKEKRGKMKIVIKIEKKHLYFLALFLLIVGVGIAIASTWDNSQSHDTLWTTAIKGKNTPTINVYDDLRLTTGKSLCLNEVCYSVWPSSSLLGTGTANYLTKWTGTNTIGSSLIYDTGANVGIGTTTPLSLYALDVVSFSGGRGIRGHASSGGAIGVEGRADAPGAWGVYGVVSRGNGVGVVGVSSEITGVGGQFYGKSYNLKLPATGIGDVNNPGLLLYITAGSCSTDGGVQIGTHGSYQLCIKSYA